MEPALVSDWPISRASEYDHSPKQMNSLGSKHFFCVCVWPCYNARCLRSKMQLFVLSLAGAVCFVSLDVGGAEESSSVSNNSAITTLVHWTECAKWLILYYKDRIFWKRKSKKIVNCLVHSPVLKVRSSATLDLPNSFQLTFCGLFQIFKISNCCSNLSGWSLTLD